MAQRTESRGLPGWGRRGHGTPWSRGPAGFLCNRAREIQREQEKIRESCSPGWWGPSENEHLIPLFPGICCPPAPARWYTCPHTCSQPPDTRKETEAFSVARSQVAGWEVAHTARLGQAVGLINSSPSPGPGQSAQQLKPNCPLSLAPCLHTSFRWSHQLALPPLALRKVSAPLSLFSPVQACFPAKRDALVHPRPRAVRGEPRPGPARGLTCHPGHWLPAPGEGLSFSECFHRLYLL